VIHFEPLVVWELSISRYCLSLAIHACEWALVFILWRDTYFRLCCTLYATGHDHVLALWVVPHVLEGIWWIGYYLVFGLVFIFYVVLWWWCANFNCKLLLLYGLIGQQRSAVEWDSTLGYRHLSQRHEIVLWGINIIDLGV
jgi:hypothetical protein